MAEYTTTERTNVSHSSDPSVMSSDNNKTISDISRDDTPFKTDTFSKDDKTSKIVNEHRNVASSASSSRPSDVSHNEVPSSGDTISPPSSRSQTTDSVSSVPKIPLPNELRKPEFETKKSCFGRDDPATEHASKRPRVDFVETKSSVVLESETQLAATFPIKPSDPQLYVHVPDETQVSTSAHSDIEQSNINKITKRQEERLAKQRLREIERLEREQKKEEERKLKKEEREKKEQERKHKRELLEIERQEKREQERLRKEKRRQKVDEERRAKEKERKHKEIERKMKEEERKKAAESKDRSQMKIMNFFSVSKGLAGDSEGTVVTSKANSVANFGKEDSKISSTPNGEPRKSQECISYHTDFLPFFQKCNTKLAPQLQLIPSLLHSSISAFDKQMCEPQSAPALDTFLLSSESKPPQSVTSSQIMVDALNSSQMTESMLYRLVENLPQIKYLQFYENSKPPYVGTWCSEKHLATHILPKDPLDTSLAGIDYNYDSDLDWQDGDEGDGEDIDDLDEGEEEEEDIEDDEMEDFVDNSESNKRGVVGPLQSISVWNDGNMNDIFDSLKYERLHFDIDFPINPFKNYWAQVKEENAESVPAAVPVPVSVAQEKPVTSIFHIDTPKKVETVERSQIPNILTPQKPVIKEEAVLKNLMEFIKANSDFSIGTLSELAKKEFKVYTKSILKHTIQEIAFYNKKTSSWEIKDVESSTV